MLLLVIPLPVHAISSIRDADAVITMRNGNPCFSYPRDEEIQKRPYSFGYLDVSKKGHVGGGGWEIGIASPDRKGLLEPDSPETCVEYGVLNPGMEVRQAAEPLLFDTPYRVLIRVTERPGERYSYTRRYLSNFCVTRNEKGETVLVAASGDGKGEWRCLKPGEKPRRGFWERLFGK
ncbi:MAG: hypothetical protein ABFD62_02170 [Syntrophaceae bacterium]